MKINTKKFAHLQARNIANQLSHHFVNTFEWMHLFFIPSQNTNSGEIF